MRKNVYQSEVDRYKVQIERGGKPLPGVQIDNVSTVDEEVMEWTDAGHIHGWFVDKVQNGKHDGGEYHVSQWKLAELLEVCEAVLAGSPLIKEPFKASEMYSALRKRMDPSGTAPKLIRNVTIANKLLPIRQFDLSAVGQYDEEYLKVVKETRDWAERMLIDNERGVQGSIYYSSTRR